MSTVITRSLAKFRNLFFALLPSVAILVVGCGGDHPQQGANSDSSASLAGIVKGGPFPVQGATVTLYATQSNGYGGAGLKLASTTSANDGTFSFNSSNYVCPAGQQAYITAAGGVVGANANNPNSLLMTAIGPCSSLTDDTYIWIDDPTTVAAAYALDNFISIDGDTVNISAPANNNAATGKCTGTGPSMTCVAAGLPHAFLNAQMLVDGIGIVSDHPTGTTNSNPPQNPGSSNLISSLGTIANPYTLGNTIPVPVINSLANILQDCVNTSGGAAGDGTNCGNLFQYSTPSNLYSASTNAPTNTLQAIINIARYPFVNVSSLYTLSSSNNFYYPSLSKEPADWSISIQYHSVGINSTVLPLGVPFNVALDANDNVFVAGNSAGTSPTGTGATPVLVSQLSSNGAGNWQTSLTDSTLCATGLTGNLCNIATDALGNLYLADSGYLYQINASGSTSSFSLALDASTTLKPVNVAVDRYNNIFVSSNNTAGTANLAMYPAGSNSTTIPSAVTASGKALLLSPIPGGLGFDSNGDLGITLYGGSSAMRTVFLPNISSTNTVFDAAQQGTISTSVRDSQMGSVTFDAKNNWYTLSLADLYMFPAGLYNGTATQITGSGGSQMRLGAIDGNGTIWIADPTTGGGVIRSYYASLPTPAFAAVPGCMPWGSGLTTVTSTSTATTSTASTLCNPAIWNGGSSAQRPFRGGRNIAIDSTGAIWSGTSGNFSITQILGVAAPAWPLLSYAKFGVEPQ